MPVWKKLTLLFLLFALWQLPAPLLKGRAASPPQSLAPEEQARNLLEEMTPEERVGQLFLVSFLGTDVSPDSSIYDLIANHHVGGVVLEAKNDNFSDVNNLLAATQELVSALQHAEWQSAQGDLLDPATLEAFRPTYVPLFVGISQNGDGYPYDQIYSGLTELPSPMAIGATWQPELAERVGFVAGQELAALGFNLLFGPSLDVLETPRPETLGDLGVRTFGGDPFWVGEMGSAYVRGVHLGSAGQIAVIGKNFPGYGGSDRPPQEEVPTVRKSLEQLKQIELAPFFSVTGDAPSPEATVDGLLLAHIRYQGLQGNIRFTTRPISFDEQAFATIMGLPAFSTWRAGGGIIATDDLSSRAVRRFYDPSNLDFKAWLVARDAFQVGSDLLFLGTITSTGDPDSYTSIVDVLNFFTQKYRNDLIFARRVDESVLRILTLKFKLFGAFELENALPNEADLAGVGLQEAVSIDVAQQGATLISPALSDLDTALPDAPEINDRVIFISDTYNYQQCSQCPLQPVFSIEAFQQAVLRLYGLEAGNQVIRQNLFSFTFDDLLTMLDNPGSFHAIEVRMRSGQWLVFSMLDVQSNRASSQALRRFLSERDDLIRGKRVIVFAFNAPYYLDTTDISKLTAYFGLYSRSPQFIDTAARILFKEFTPIFGALPVSVPGIGYDLITATSPDPSQSIPVLLDLPSFALPTPEAGEGEDPPLLEPTQLPEFEIGAIVPIRTGVIVDHNGHPVPDGTVVQFVFNRNGEVTFSPPIETVRGVARTTYLINGGGQLTIQALSEPATQSIPLVIEIPGPEATVIPTLTPTQPAPPSATPEVIPSPTPLPVVSDQPPPHLQTDLIDWGLSLLTTLAASLVVYQFGLASGQTRWSFRWALCVWIGGVGTYIYFALNLPGARTILLEGGRAGLIWLITVGAGFGWLGGWVWKRLTGRAAPPVGPQSSLPAKTKSGSG